MITPAQIRAARALKSWSQSDLATRAGLAVPSIANIELGKQKPSAATLTKIYEAFDAADIKFLENDGVRRRTDAVHIYKGKKGFCDFMDDVYETVKKGGGEICVSNVDERDWIKWMTQEGYDKHAQRMAPFKENINFRIIVKENDWFFIADKIAEYRWVPEEQFASVPFYVYGNKLAIILFLDEPLIFLIHSEDAAQAFREKFDIAWEQAITLPK